MKNNYLPLKKGKGESETSFWLNFAVMLVIMGVLVACRCIGFTNLIGLFFVVMIVATIGIISLEYFIYPETSALRQWKVLRKVSWKRVFYKEVTLIVTLGVIGGAYWLFPCFMNNVDFKPLYVPFLIIMVPLILLLSLPYFALMDKIDKDPDDEYYKIGYAITHFQKTMTRFELANYVRSWLVKAFWLSLMQPWVLYRIDWFINLTWETLQDDPIRWFWFFNSLCFFIDLLYGSIGYVLSFKIFNTYTRTAEPTLLGWVVAIMCYWPFWDILFYNQFFPYAEISWLNFFDVGSVWWYIWASIIVLLEMMYGLASVSFGLRFSNLTYRGLVNTGLYKYTKHPAYVFKNLSWWFVNVPFLAAGFGHSLKLCLLLFGVNIIYYLRAKTEERHLSHYPEYEAYALAMNEKSIFRWVAKILPFLKYKPLPKDKRLF